MRLASYASVVMALTLISLKLWAWYATDSVALLSSLADSLLDLVASLITLFAVKVAVSPADREHRFGHGKSEGIAGLAQALIVTGSAAYVGVEAVTRLLAPSPIMQPGLGLGVMFVSLVLTVGLVVFQGFVVRQTGSLAISADAVHYKADILTNVAVLGAIFASVQWQWHILDPLLGLVVVALILLAVRIIAMDAIDVLLDRELPEEDRQRIKDVVVTHPGVKGIHDLRTRSSGAAQFIQFHLELDAEISLVEAHEICDAVESDVQSKFPGAEVLIHADPYGLLERRDAF
ncbi:MAG: cation diffusion facilitator family transporter [Gammaproteobacteria bacterium]